MEICGGCRENDDEEVGAESERASLSDASWEKKGGGISSGIINFFWRDVSIIDMRGIE